MVILFGACSGVDLGNMMVRTPWSMFALMSSGYRHTSHISTSTSSATATTNRGAKELNATHLDTLRDGERAGELAEAALADGVAALVAVALHGALAGHGEHVVLEIDVDVLLGESGELELRRHHVPVPVLMQVHPARTRASVPVGEAEMKV